MRSSGSCRFSSTGFFNHNNNSHKNVLTILQPDPINSSSKLSRTDRSYLICVFSRSFPFVPFCLFLPSLRAFNPHAPLCATTAWRRVRRRLMVATQTLEETEEDRGQRPSPRSSLLPFPLPAVPSPSTPTTAQTRTTSVPIPVFCTPPNHFLSVRFRPC